MDFGEKYQLLEALPGEGVRSFRARQMQSGREVTAHVLPGASSSPETKALLAREQDMSLSAALELEAATQALLMTGKDYAEFHAAFTAGRQPRWHGR